MTMRLVSGYQIDIIYSPTEGYYAEVWEAGTGEELYSGAPAPTPREARRDALTWCETHLARTA